MLIPVRVYRKVSKGLVYPFGIFIKLKFRLKLPTVWLCVLRDFKTINFQFTTIFIACKIFQLAIKPALRISLY